MLGVQGLAEEDLPGEGAVGPFGDDHLGAVGLDRGAVGADGQHVLLDGQVDGLGGDAGQVQATGDYWKGPFYRLEAEGFECVLADAKQVKNLPGRPKRDPADSRWLAACFERGAVTACFVATPEFRIIRLHAPLPAGPDRRTHPGQAARGEAAGIGRDQGLLGPD